MGKCYDCMYREINFDDCGSCSCSRYINAVWFSKLDKLPEDFGTDNCSCYKKTNLTYRELEDLYEESRRCYEAYYGFDRYDSC